MSEDEIGQEFDRVIRAAAMAVGQLRQHHARRQSERDSRTRGEQEQTRRTVEQHSREVLDSVRSREFWNVANGDRVATAVSFAAESGVDVPHTQAIYDTVRSKLASGFNIDLDDLRSLHPESEAARRNALAHAVDDAIAARHADRDADASSTESETLDAAAASTPDAERAAELVDGSEHAADTAAALTGDADALRDHAHGDLAAANAPTAVLPVVDAARPLTPAQHARRAADVSYPLGARDSLNTAATSGQVKPRRVGPSTKSRDRDVARSR